MRAVTLILVLGLVALASGIKVYNQNSALTLSCCGSHSYDTTTSFCCIDTVFQNSNSDTNQCCSNKRLGNNQQCCNVVSGVASINDRAISTSLSCCGTEGYDPSTQLCCSNNNVLSNKNGNLQCCGNNKAYDPSTDLCCNTASVSGDNCKGINVNVNYNVIVNGQANGKQCCASSSYDPSTQLCCGDSNNAHVVSNGNNNLQCCGSSSYDATKQTCCEASSDNTYTLPDGSTITITTVSGNVASGSGLTCCDDGSLRAYDSATSFCCNGGNIIKQNSASSLACCGSRSFDQNTQTCCSRDVTSYKKSTPCCGGCAVYTQVTNTEYNIGSPANAQCCDNKPFDDTKSFCCGNNLFNQNSANSLSCCGDQSYDSSNDICCTDTTQTYNAVFKNKLNNNVNYDCCLNFGGSSCNIQANFALFDTSKQSCPCGKVLDQSKDISLNNNDPNVQAGCCGTTQIDVNSQTCCPNAIYAVDPAIGLKCCSDDGKTLYNPGYQVCCSKSKSSCSVPCGVKAKELRDVEEVESVEEVENVEDVEQLEKKKKKKTSSKNKVQCGDSCCSGTGYFASFQRCCNGKILDYNGVLAGSSPVTCCGDQVYNTNFRKCCIETDVKSQNSCGASVSTSYAIFDANSEICCGSGSISVA